MSPTPDDAHNHDDDKPCPSCGGAHPPHMVLDVHAMSEALNREDVPADVRSMIAMTLLTIETLVDGYDEVATKLTAVSMIVACMAREAGGEMFLPALTALQYEHNIVVRTTEVHDGPILSGHKMWIDMDLWDENVRKGMN